VARAGLAAQRFPAVYPASVRFPTPSSAVVRDRMQRQARQDTRPELELRRLLHAEGLRYRVGVKVPDFPRRTIDIAFPSAKVAVFVDGCFWHGCPEHGSNPSANAEAWRAKFLKNQQRDASTTKHLARLGWEVVRIWEHETPESAVGKVAGIINRRRSSAA
jgi:DNA mismatch endonuclease (patch repair protein)